MGTGPRPDPLQLAASVSPTRSACHRAARRSLAEDATGAVTPIAVDAERSESKGSPVRLAQTGRNGGNDRRPREMSEHCRSAPLSRIEDREAAARSAAYASDD